MEGCGAAGLVCKQIVISGCPHGEIWGTNNGNLWHVYERGEEQSAVAAGDNKRTNNPQSIHKGKNICTCTRSREGRGEHVGGHGTRTKFTPPFRIKYTAQKKS